MLEGEGGADFLCSFRIRSGMRGGGIGLRGM